LYYLSSKKYIIGKIIMCLSIIKIKENGPKFSYLKQFFSAKGFAPTPVYGGLNLRPVNPRLLYISPLVTALTAQEHQYTQKQLARTPLCT
jgi:hypothetical protein